MSRANTSEALALLGIDLGCRFVSASFLLPGKNGQPTLASGWPGAEDATAVVVPFQCDRLPPKHESDSGPPSGWGYLALTNSVVFNFLLASKPNGHGESIRRELSSHGLTEAAIPSAMTLLREPFARGLKLHLESCLQLAYGKEVLDGSYAACCVFPAWMQNPSQGDVMDAMSTALASNITCCPAPAACLTYYLSKTKKPQFTAGELYLHCSIEETTITLSHHALRSQPGNTLALASKACQVLLCGAYNVRDSFYEGLEELLLSECPNALPEDPWDIFRKLDEISESFYKWACSKFDANRDFKTRLPWNVPDCERRGFTVRKGQLIVASSKLRERCFSPLLDELYIIMKEIVSPSKTKTYILMTGGLSECPFLAQALRTLITDGERKGDLVLLTGMNGVTAASRGAAIIIDGGRKHATARKRWPDWTPIVKPPRKLQHRMPILEKLVREVEEKAIALESAKKSSSTESDLASTRKRAGVILAEYSRRAGPTKETFSLANCCQRIGQRLGKSNETEDLRKHLETVTNEAQDSVEATHRLEGLHYAALHGVQTAIEFFNLAGFSVNKPSGSAGRYENYRPIHLAVVGGHEDILLQLLQLGADLTARTGTGLTALHIAVVQACGVANGDKRFKALDMLRLVVKKAAMSMAGLSMEDDLGATPLDTAVALGDEEVVCILEAAGGRGNTRREKMRADAVIAVERNDLESLRTILADRAAGVFLSSHIGSANSSILQVSLEIGRIEAAGMILKTAGVDVDHKNDSGDTALGVAITKGDTVAIELLLSNKASLSVVDSKGMAPIHKACLESSKHPGVLHLILKHHLSRSLTVNIPSSDGWTALHLAVELGQVGFAELLIQHGASIEAASSPSCGRAVLTGSRTVFSRSKAPNGLGGQWRPLHIAATTGNEAMVHLLLKKGARRDSKDGEGCTAAERAAANGFNNIVKLLLFESQASASPAESVESLNLKPDKVKETKRSKSELLKKVFSRSKNSKGVSIVAVSTSKPLRPELASLSEATATLHAAITSDSREIVQTLIQYPLVNSKSAITGWTPLSRAVIHGRIDMIKILLAAGADPIAPNTDGTTAVHLAAGHADPQVFLELKDFAGKIGHPLLSQDQRALIFAATKSGSPETVRRLIQEDKKQKKPWPYQGAAQDALWQSIVLQRMEVSRIMVQENWPCRLDHFREALATCNPEYARLICGTKSKILQETAEDGCNAFHYCAERGNGEMCRLLLSRWAGSAHVSLTSVAKNGLTPFLTAISKGNMEVMKIIMDLEPEERWRDIEPSALSCAFWQDKFEVVTLLVGYKDYSAYTADVLAKAMVKDGKTSEHAVKIIEAILKHRPDITKGGQLNNGYDEILTAASGCGNMQIVNILMPYLTSKTGREQLGQSLVAAAEKDQEELVKHIWDKQESIRTSKHASIALLRTAETGSVGAARTLLSSTATDSTGVFSTDEIWSGLEAAGKGGHTSTMRAFYDAADCAADSGAGILHFAIRTDKDVLLKALLDLGVSVKWPNPDGWPALHAAVMEGNKRVAEVILARHATSIDGLGPQGRTVLHAAVVSERADMVAWLLEKGAKAKTADEQGDLAIHLAAQLKHELVMKQLCAHSSCDLDLFKAKNKAGKTAVEVGLENPSNALRVLLQKENQVMNRVEPSTLHHRCREGNVEAVKLLLEHGADPNGLDSAKDKYTPLQDAIWKNKEEVIKVLLQTGRCDLNAKCSDGHSALSLALNYQFIPLAKLLHEAGASLGAERDFQKWQPVHDAARYNRMEVLRFLVDAGADLRAKTSAGLHALHLAAYGGHIEAAELLLSKWVPIDEPDNEKKTPLKWAVDGQHLAMVRFLIQAGANVHWGRLSASSALHMAAESASTEIVEALLDAGADIDQLEHTKHTPLHWAAFTGQVDNVRLLLARGADIRCRNENSKTPLHLAAQAGHVGALEVLLDAAPEDLDLAMGSGETPLLVAAWWHRAEVIRVLGKRGANCAQVTNSDQKNNALMMACSSDGDKIKDGVDGVIGAIAALLDLGMDINGRNAAGYDPLIYAIFYLKSEKVVELLLNRGAKANTSVELDDGSKKSALMFAVAQDQPAGISRLLIQHGASVSATWRKWNALQHAVEQQNTEAIEVLVKARPDLLNFSGELSFPPLHVAAQMGFHACIDGLVRLGADVNGRSTEGYAPIYLAAHKLQPESIRALARHKASLETHEPDENGYTPLYRAMLDKGSECLETVRTLLKCGAQPDGPSKSRWLPIHLAAQMGQVDLLQVLFDHKSNINAQTIDSNGLSALHIAAANNCAEAVKWLLSHGAPVNTFDKEGLTPLLYSISKNGPAARDVLLAWPGCSTLVIKDTTHTALNTAAEHGHPDAVRALYKHDKKLLHAKGISGNTPLHSAAGASKYENVRVLLELGASITVKNDHGASPVMSAASLDNVEVLRLFPVSEIQSARMGTAVPWTTMHVAASKGNLNVCREIALVAPDLMNLRLGGKTPLILAKEGGHSAVVEMLLNPGGVKKKTMVEILRSPERLKRVGG